MAESVQCPNMQQWQLIFIDLIEWAYFFCWSISFYGQIWENYRLKNVEGMNLDFVELNITGFLFYSIYNTQGYFFNEDQTGQVDLTDALFSYHALLATLYTLYQSFIYQRGNNKVHFITKVILGILWTFTFLYWVITHYTHVVHVPKHFGVFTLMGLSKIIITMLKYAPQLYWNYLRKSTKGWSIMAVVLDFTGGILSFSSMFLQILFDPQCTEMNFIKILLGLSASGYNIFFILQHYYWYGPVDHKQQESLQSSATQVSNYQEQMAEKENIEAQTENIDNQE